MYRHSLILLIVGSFVAGSGCQGDQSAAPSADLPSIPVSHPVEREVTNYEEFTGRTDAVQVVDIRARVTGYLTKMPFKEGSEVKEGDLLFEVDPRPYQAQYDSAISQVTLNEASLNLARKVYERDLKAGDSVSPQQLDQDKAAVEEAVARVASSKASTEVYKLNLEFAHVKSPIDGQVSRYYMTRGNLVNQDQTLLTTLVSLDPMYSYFDLDEPSFLRIRRAIIEGRLTLPEDGQLTVLMGLPSEDGFPHVGTLNFVNNQINSGTGSIAMRGVFENPKLPRSLPSLSANAFGMLTAPDCQGPLLALAPFVNAKSTRLLAPGMFVRIRLPLGKPFKASLIIDKAILSDQDRKYVYVVDENNKVQYRRITTKALQEDGLRVVEGVSADEWVVTSALQQVRPGMEIRKEEHPMRTLGGRTGDEKAGSEKMGKGKSEGN